MKYFKTGSALFGALALLCVAPMPAPCQDATPPPPPAAPARPPAKLTPVPKLLDGHPDLNGFWASGTGPDTPVHSTFGPRYPEVKRGGDQTAKIQVADPNQPPYKPELMAKVAEMSKFESKYDPAFYCKPGGVPRIGPPHAIFQVPGKPIIAFLYELNSGNTFRLIPVDGRPHDPDADESYYGDSVGHWEGDTLVIDTIHLSDDTWLGLFGWFHSTNLHVVERISREGELLHYQATVDDPDVFTKPWTMNPWVSRLETKELLIENPPCTESDIGHITTFDEKTKTQ